MQNSGLGNAVNPITSMLQIYQIPVILLVSHRGEPGKPDEPQHQLMGQITYQLAELCGLRTSQLDPQTFEKSLKNVLSDGVPAAWVFRRGILEGGPKAPPIDLRVSSKTVVPGNQGIFHAELTRERVLELLLPFLNQASDKTKQSGLLPAVICTTGKLSRELYELDDRDHQRGNRFYMVGSLGCAAGFGLGVARAQPSRPVLVLDGDGGALMKLGTLATIGALGLSNLHHLLFDNGAHESTGGQPTSSPSMDFASMALSVGYRLAETVADEKSITDALKRHLQEEGPSLLRILIRTGSRPDLGRPKLSPRDGWLRFCATLKESS
jgi:phosphonopyruvate decarboxylase